MADCKLNILLDMAERHRHSPDFKYAAELVFLYVLTDEFGQYITTIDTKEGFDLLRGTIQNKAHQLDWNQSLANQVIGRCHGGWRWVGKERVEEEQVDNE